MRPMGMTAVALGVAGAFALGIWSSPAIRGAYTGVSAHEAAPAVVSEDATPAPATPARVKPVAREENFGPTVSKVTLSKLPITDEVRDRVKPLLARGTNLALASEGFSDAEQFAAVAHASKNTGVPFVILKNRVLEQKQSLADAIRMTVATANATVEAERARAEARSDVVALQAQWGPI